MTERIDIGDNHQIKFVEYQGDAHTAANVYHLKPDGSPCEGFIPFDGGEWAKAFRENPIEVWQVQSFEPLTCSPSILCRVCGDHGFIRDGRWVTA